MFFVRDIFDQQSNSKNLLLIGYPTLNSNLEQTLLCAVHTFLSDLTFGLLSSQRLICVRVIIMEVGFSTILNHRVGGTTLGRWDTYQSFQRDGTVQLFGTKGQKFLHCPGTKGQWDKLKILPRGTAGQGNIFVPGQSPLETLILFSF